MDWDTCARELGRALSRYNGLTNSAKLDLIADITGDDGLFDNQPFAYAYKIREYFEKYVKKRSAEVHMHHGIAFGFLYRALPGASFYVPDISNKMETTTHMALTPLGRTLRAAVKSGREDLRKFVLSYALLDADFDMYALLIKMADENGGEIPAKKDFEEAFNTLLRKRLEWMEIHFPISVQRRQIQRHVLWIGLRTGSGKKGPKREFVMDRIFEFEGQTPEHHFYQRRKWARETLGHLDGDNPPRLTQTGKDFASLLPSISDSPFFWLGPSEDCARARIIRTAQISPCQCSPAWRLLRPQSEMTDESQKEEMADKIADFMVSEFDNIQLGRFRQSSLDVVAPYLYFLEGKYGGKVDEHAFFSNLLKRRKDKFACFQQPSLAKSHFRLRSGV